MAKSGGGGGREGAERGDGGQGTGKRENAHKPAPGIPANDAAAKQFVQQRAAAKAKKAA